MVATLPFKIMFGNLHKLWVRWMGLQAIYSPFFVYFIQFGNNYFHLKTKILIRELYFTKNRRKKSEQPSKNWMIHYFDLITKRSSSYLFCLFPFLFILFSQTHWIFSLHSDFLFRSHRLACKHSKSSSTMIDFAKLDKPLTYAISWLCPKMQIGILATYH